MGKWVRVYSTTDPGKAAIYHGRLNENGIPAVIMNKQDSSYVFLGKVEIHVAEDNEGQAKALLGDLESSDP